MELPDVYHGGHTSIGTEWFSPFKYICPVRGIDVTRYSPFDSVSFLRPNILSIRGSNDIFSNISCFERCTIRQSDKDALHYVLQKFISNYPTKSLRELGWSFPIPSSSRSGWKWTDHRDLLKTIPHTLFRVPLHLFSLYFAPPIIVLSCTVWKYTKYVYIITSIVQHRNVHHGTSGAQWKGLVEGRCFNVPMSSHPFSIGLGINN